MKALVCTLTAVGLFLLWADGVDAKQTPRKNRRSYGYTASPEAQLRERQMRNLRGYERGEYYEHDSHALPFGSRAWWEQKEREGADER